MQAKRLVILGMKTLTEMLTEREAIAQLCETILDEGTEHWGVKVFFIELPRNSKQNFLNLLFRGAKGNWEISENMITYFVIYRWNE